MRPARKRHHSGKSDARVELARKKVARRKHDPLAALLHPGRTGQLADQEIMGRMVAAGVAFVTLDGAGIGCNPDEVQPAETTRP